MSVIVPAYNAAATLGEQLEALSKQDWPNQFEVLVMDDGSVDGTSDVAFAWSGRLSSLRVIRSTRNLGTGATREEGASRSGGDFMVFCDADDVVKPGWLRGLVDAAAGADLVGGPLEVLDDGSSTKRFRSPPPRDELQVGLGFLPATMGGNLGVWREVWDKVGGFDPQWRHGDDWEFSFRVQLAGYRIAFAPDAVIGYRFRRGIRSNMRQRFRYGLTQAELAAAFRRDGLVPTGLWRGIRTWGSIVRHVPDLAGDPSTRGRYLIRVAQRAGRLVGSIRCRVVYL